MKSILIIIFSLLSTLAIGQKVHTGTFFTSKKDIGFESDIFQFKSDGSFNYIFFTCTGVGLGHGHYEIITGDSLQLNFHDCQDCEETIQVDYSTEPSDSLSINLVVKDYDDQDVLPGANIFFPETKKGVSANINGSASFTVVKPDSLSILKIQFIGLDPLEIKIPKNTTRLTGSVYLPSHWIYNSTDSMTFKILKWTSTTLKLRRYPTISKTYKYISPDKTHHLIRDRMGENGYLLYTKLD